jgi:hypothetical protein
MSKFVQVKTQLREVEMIKRALDDLELRYSEDSTYRHRWSGMSYSVPLLIQQGALSFGLRPGADGTYEIVGDDMQMRRIRAIGDQVAQRYAYHMVLAETQKAGFDLVEESVGEDRVIRMTVRRWN